eukprot:1561508-Prymnesium_polylepis.2
MAARRGAQRAAADARRVVKAGAGGHAAGHCVAGSQRRRVWLPRRDACHPPGVVTRRRRVLPWPIATCVADGRCCRQWRYRVATRAL